MILSQESWSGLPFPSPGGVPDPGIEPMLPALQADFGNCAKGSPEIKIPLFLNFWGRSGLSVVEITHKIVFAARKVQAEETILSGNAVK